MTANLGLVLLIIAPEPSTVRILICPCLATPIWDRHGFQRSINAIYCLFELLAFEATLTSRRRYNYPWNFGVTEKRPKSSKPCYSGFSSKLSMIATSLEDDQRLLEISHFHSMPISCLETRTETPILPKSSFS